MGKKSKIPPLEEVLERPWCYYCERDFDDLKVLQDHQRARHFKCSRCTRRLNTINGLRVHTEQVHKAAITEVDNCTVPERNTIDREIFGMEGIPQEDLDAHRNRVKLEYYKIENEWRMKTGNPITGPNPNQRKRDHEDDPETLKARMEEHRKKRRAERAARTAGTASQTSEQEPSEPSATLYSINTDPHTTPGFFPQSITSPAIVGSPFPPGAPPNFIPAGYTPGNMSYVPTAQAPVNGYQGSAFPQQTPTTYAAPLPTAISPLNAMHGFVPPPVSGNYNGVNGYLTKPPFVPGVPIGVPPTASPALNSPSFGTGSRNPSPNIATNVSPAPLPNRPNFNTPAVGREVMEKMHAGHHDRSNSFDVNNALPNLASTIPTAQDIDDLIADGMAQAQRKSSPDLPASNNIAAPESITGTAPKPTPEATTSVQAVEEVSKKSKKQKLNQLPGKLVYADNNLCPEERMAGLDKFKQISTKTRNTIDGTVA